MKNGKQERKEGGQEARWNSDRWVSREGKERNKQHKGRQKEARLLGGEIGKE